MTYSDYQLDCLRHNSLSETKGEWGTETTTGKEVDVTEGWIEE